MSELLYQSAAQMARQIRQKSISSRELVTACLQRIDQVNPAINAVVQLCPQRALDEADKLDQAAAHGEWSGPLHGVPITLKDSLDTEGVISTGGTLGRKNYIPDVDAPVVARLRRAGAVLIGKTNTPELTLSGETNNLIYGRTRNPFDLERSPGGSSGGSAAIIASGGSALELGSDTGGSIREPAHLCGICGIKPTMGRAPRSGHIVPYAGGVLDSLTQIGPMARYVEDLSLSLPLICGPDGEDPSVVPVPMKNPADVDLSSLRIAWYDDNNIVTPDENLKVAVNQVVEGLQREGLQLEARLLPGMPRLVNLTTELRESANAGLILRLLERYGTTEPGPDLQGYLTEKSLAGANRVDPVLMESIDQARSEALAFFAGHDAIICPPSHALARPHGSSHADSFDDWSYMTIFNLLGWPGISVPVRQSDQGLPVGVQIIAAPWREDVCLALGEAVERVTGGFQPPSL